MVGRRGARLVVVVVIVVVRISFSRSISIRVRIRIGISSRSTRIVVIVVVVEVVVEAAVAVVVVCMPALHRSVCHESVGQMFLLDDGYAVLAHPKVLASTYTKGLIEGIEVEDWPRS